MRPETFARMRDAARRVLLLDYDGTLVPFAPRPELAPPDGDLFALLRRLAALEHTEVHVVSGRPRSVLAEWLGGLPVGLHAEHGLWSRARRGTSARESPGEPDRGRWERLVHERPSALAPATELLARAATKMTGAMLERKSLGAALHYRAVEPALAALEIAEIERGLGDLGAHTGVELLHGTMVLELRVKGVHKGRVVQRLRAHARPETLFVAVGDDRTDEDLFEATSAIDGGLSLHVGKGPSIAHEMLADSVSVRALLSRLCEAVTARDARW